MNGRIFAIAALSLAGFAALNLISVGDRALAFVASAAPDDQEVETEPAEAEAPEESGAPGEAAQAEPEPAVCESNEFLDDMGASAQEFQVLSSLQQRRREIEAMESEAETRVQLAAAAEARVEERIAELKAVEGEIKALLGQLDEAEEERVVALVTMYEKMDAKDAAPRLAALSPGTALMILSRMKDSNKAEVIGEMEIDDATRLTEALAEDAKIEPVKTGLEG